MDYSSLRTAADIINAFRECQNAGEQIDLFEALATNDAPPIEAFVEILRNVKLEAVVALTIQAFGKIKDADIRERLKRSDDLLAILSEQAQSGQTELIRWSAATTIENLKFDFIALFEEFIAKHQYNANQINFLRAVQSVFLQKRRLEVADLYEGALARFGKNAVDRFFSDDEVDDLLAFTELLAA